MATFRNRKSAATGETSVQAIVRRKGYPDQRKTFTDRQAAEDWAYDVERDIRDRRVDPRALAERKTLNDAITLYLRKVKGVHKSYKDTVARCEYFREALGGVALSDLHPVMIDEALDTLGCSGPTKNRYLGSLSGCLEFVRKSPYTWIKVNPCKAVTRRKEHKGRSRIITTAEWEQILAVADSKKTARSARKQQLPTYLRLAYSLGRRRGELLKLRWVDLDLDAGEAHLLDTKTGDDQVVPLSDEDVAMLERHQAEHQVKGWQYVFRGRYPDKPTNFDELISPIIRDVCPPDRKGEVPVFHSVRHTVLTQMGDGGATEAQIKAASGHKNSASVDRYVNKTVEAARGAQELRRRTT